MTPLTTRRKLIVASNRLPASLEIENDVVETRPSAGGLASAVSGLQQGSGFAWVGWPGCPVPPHLRSKVEGLMAEHDHIPVYIDEDQERLYYRGLCNEVLWPLFHYFTDRATFDAESWQAYVEVNRQFADRILEIADDDSCVWVHDFHLMLVPSMLRERRPDLEIGFFLHIPFPSSEIYRTLPKREEVLRGVLGADYIGFHTNDYARHFGQACLRVLGLSGECDSVTYEGRRVGIGTHPIGIDVAGFLSTLDDPVVAQNLVDLAARYGGRKLILGVERLDYTKGVPQKLQAFEQFLARDPERAQHVTFLQVLVPSRMNHSEYQGLKSEIEELIGRINGQYGGPGVTPIEYMHRSLTPTQLVALYRYADVGLVTPVRDGMNLVAQEFVLCQRECAEVPQAHRGILVLSEFAGAAHYLSRSILVNPNDTESAADALETALAMTPGEKRERMASMAQQVEDMNCHRWAQVYLSCLADAAERSRSMMCRNRIGPSETAAITERYQHADRRIFALDYDGTLRELARHPDEAAPTQEILQLLRRLSEVPDTEVHLISGRKRETMQEWFGALPIHLCAEHGYVARPVGGDWQVLHDVDLTWMSTVAEILARVTNEVPGTLLERKNCALAWHYRMADPSYGEWRARELLATLEENLANDPVEVLCGHRVIEVRATGIHKGSYLRPIVQGTDPRTFILCAGDDRTDSDMYRVLPEHAHSVNVGGGGVDYRYSIESPARTRALLGTLLNSPILDGARVGS